jgi:hypothetical protein
MQRQISAVGSNKFGQLLGRPGLPPQSGRLSIEHGDAAGGRTAPTADGERCARIEPPAPERFARGRSASRHSLAAGSSSAADAVAVGATARPGWMIDAVELSRTVPDWAGQGREPETLVEAWAVLYASACKRAWRGWQFPDRLRVRALEIIASTGMDR